MINRIQAIAAALQQVGVGETSRVLIFEDATVDRPCYVLAIMRLGAVYVPLDFRNPLPRLVDVAASCKPAAILVDSRHSHPLLWRWMRYLQRPPSHQRVAH